MPERRKHTEWWHHPFIQKLPALAKLLYDYLNFNPYCNRAGLYHITLKTISFDTGIKEEEIPDLLKLLEKNIAWYPESNIVWAKEFLNRQNNNSWQFLKGAAKDLGDIDHPEIVKELIEYNLKKHDLSLSYVPNNSAVIPEQNPIKPQTDDLKVAGMMKYFEDKLGRMPTPKDLECLKDFADNYTDGWFEKAVDEAVKNNARAPMRYIEKIMENWRTEGVNPLAKSRTKAHQGESTKASELKESLTKRLR